MVISTYKRIDKNALWHSGQINGADVVNIKIGNSGKWLNIKDNGDGTHEISYPEKCHHGGFFAGTIRATMMPTKWLEKESKNDRCVCDKCGQPHDPKLHGTFQDNGKGEV